MPFDTGDFIEVTANMKFGGKDIQNTFHFIVQTAGSNDQSDQLDDVGECIENIYGPLEAVMPDELTFDSISVYDLTQDAPIGNVAWPTFTVGANLQPPLSPALALVSRLTLGLPRREGRKYWGPWCDSENEAPGVADSGAVGIVQLAAVRFSLAFSAGNGAILRGRVRTNQLGVFVFAPISSIIVNNEWDFQRRRKISVGS
jgi:hypothetical protein